MPTATQTAESPSPGDTNSLLVQCRAFIDDGNAVRAKELLEPMLRSLQAEPEISRASIDALLLYANAQRQTGNFRDSLNNLHRRIKWRKHQT